MYSTNQKLLLGIVINVCFTVFELFVGSLSHSLSLTSDAIHNLADVFSLMITYSGCKIAAKKPTLRKTCGYGKATIIATFLNGLILGILACSIFLRSYYRWYSPEHIEGGLVIGVSFLGIVINGLIALLFFRERHDLIFQSALFNMFFDALASAGALGAGIIILVTGYTFIDTIVSVGIGFLLLLSSFIILKESLHLLLAGIPSYLDLHKIRSSIKATNNVLSVNDLRVWPLSTREAALSCQVIITSKSLQDSVNVIKDLKQKLKTDYNIAHVTIEIGMSYFPAYRSEFPLEEFNPLQEILQ